MSELPVYKKWGDIPDGIATKTTLYRDYGLKLAKDQQPVAQKIRYDYKGRRDGYYDLYDMNDCVPRKKATEAQLKALEKARYMAELLNVECSECKQEQWGRYNVETVTRKYWIENNYDAYVCRFCEDRHRAMKWASHTMTLDDVVILDTETTDFHGEIIEIAIIDLQGNVILDQRIKPQGDISPGAQAVHGISLDDLKDCSTFPEVYEQIKEAIEQQIVVIYNAAFDRARLADDCKRHGLESIKYEYDCAMEWYAQYYGDWSGYHDSYRWQPLNGGHSALSDCQATLDLIREMVAKDSE